MSIWLELYSNRLPMAWREIMSPACPFRNMDVNPFVSRPSLLVITACCIWIRKWSEWKISPRFSRVIWFPVAWSFGCMYGWMFSVQAPCLIQMKGNVAEKFSSSQTFCLLSLIIYLFLWVRRSWRNQSAYLFTRIVSLSRCLPYFRQFFRSTSV